MRTIGLLVAFVSRPPPPLGQTAPAQFIGSSVFGVPLIPTDAAAPTSSFRSLRFLLTVDR